MADAGETHSSTTETTILDVLEFFPLVLLCLHRHSIERRTMESDLLKRSILRPGHKPYLREWAFPNDARGALIEGVSRHCKGLRLVDLSCCDQLTPDVLKRFVDSSRDTLETLTIGGNPESVTTDCVLYVLENCRKLKSLDASGCTQVRLYNVLHFLGERSTRADDRLMRHNRVNRKMAIRGFLLTAAVDPYFRYAVFDDTYDALGRRRDDAPVRSNARSSSSTTLPKRPFSIETLDVSEANPRDATLWGFEYRDCLVEARVRNEDGSHTRGVLYVTPARLVMAGVVCVVKISDTTNLTHERCKLIRTAVRSATSNCKKKHPIFFASFENVAVRPFFSEGEFAPIPGCPPPPSSSSWGELVWNRILDACPKLTEILVPCELGENVKTELARRKKIAEETARDERCRRRRDVEDLGYEAIDAVAILASANGDLGW